MHGCTKYNIYLVYLRFLESNGVFIEVTKAYWISPEQKINKILDFIIGTLWRSLSINIPIIYYKIHYRYYTITVNDFNNIYLYIIFYLIKCI